MNPIVNFRPPPDLVLRIEEWRSQKRPIPTRSQAMIDLLRAALDATSPQTPPA